MPSPQYSRSTTSNGRSTPAAHVCNDDCDYFVNVYVDDKNEETGATAMRLVGHRIPYEVLLQISRHFEDVEGGLKPLPHDPHVYVWDLPNDRVSIGGCTEYLLWVKAQRLPLPEAYNGTKRFDLEPGWKIQQWRSIYEVMRYLDLSNKFSYNPIRRKIFDWVKGDAIEPKELALLWRCSDEDEGLRSLIIHFAVDFSYHHEKMDEFEAFFKETAKKYGTDDLVKRFTIKRRGKEEYFKRQRRAEEQKATNAQKTAQARRRAQPKPARYVPGSELADQE